LNDLRTDFQLPAFQDYVPSFLAHAQMDASADMPRTPDGDVPLASLAVDPPLARSE